MKLFTKLNLLIIIIFICHTSWATNGAQLIGVGPISRAMGGTGIASPQGADAGIYLNPGAMIFTNRIDLGASMFMPNVKGTVGSVSTNSQEKLFAMPSVGSVFHPKPFLAMGFALVGVGGIGTDWRSTSLAGSVGTQRLLLTQMDIILAGALKLMEGKLGIGLSIPVSYQTVDLGTGTSSDFGLAIKIGVAYEVRSGGTQAQMGKPFIRLGGYFKTPQIIKPQYKILGLDKITAPMEGGIGFSILPIPQLVLSLDAKYIAWSSAKGYGDPVSSKGYDWKDQFVIAFGTQIGSNDKPVFDFLLLRLGYNFGTDVTKSNYSWVLEAPALVQHHITFGASIDIGLSMHLNIGSVIGIANDKTIGGRTGRISTWSLDLGMSGIFG